MKCFKIRATVHRLVPLTNLLYTQPIYQNLHNFPAYESDDDYDLIFACSGTSHTTTKSSKDIAKVIFPVVDNISTQINIWWKEYTWHEWLQNCQKALKSMERKYKSDQQLKYVMECMAREFRRIMTKKVT